MFDYISLASTKICLIRLSFQTLLGVIRSETMWTCGLFGTAIGRPPKWFGSHRSRQMSVVLPSPILRSKHFFKTSLPSRIAR